ncbi:MAG: hypothetical protein HZC36_01130 [Armatimonadetes bacterium]|nr:hypothetical protein [Armatimonadota bacterium]
MPRRPLTRRDVLSGAGTLALGMALPKELSEKLTRGFPGLKQATLVPADKGLDPKWVKSLFERGKPTVYGPDELKWIGMPVGGIGSGQVYVGGDGKLWYWDLYAPGTSSQFNSAGAGHYEHPMDPASGKKGIDISVRGPLFGKGQRRETTQSAILRPPVAKSVTEIVVHESAPSKNAKLTTIEVTQETWTPLIPLDAVGSSWPLAVLECTIRNKSKTDDTDPFIKLALPNEIGKYTIPDIEIERSATENRSPGLAMAIHSAKSADRAPKGPERAPFVFEDFEDGTYSRWKVEGTAFGSRPFKVDELPDRLKTLKPTGTWLANSHESRHGEDSPASDQHLGKLTSADFVIDRPFISFLIGGGAHAGRTCMNLVVEGKVLRTAVGKNQVRLDWANWDVKDLLGKTAHLEIVDAEAGGWGHIVVDRIEFRDVPVSTVADVSLMPDFGTMAIAALGSGIEKEAQIGVFHAPANEPPASNGGVSVGFHLKPGESKTLTFVVAWHFPNFGPSPGELASITDIAKQKKHYAKRFKDAADVIRQFAKRKDELYDKTKLWIDTWYDSTLPYWFLERVYIPLNTLQTSTAWWLDSGRFYAFEGVECCAGTCQHVWNYAQSVARIFPELERDTRERVDYGIGFREDGALDYRAEAHKIIAHDGQCGTIIRTYREHTMCPDDSFLRRIWPKVKKSVQRMIQEDPNKDGVLEGWQYNTLDAAWKGKISWISSLYAAALQVGALMADEMGDPAFAKECRAIVAKAHDEIPKQLFNGEYFQMERDASAPQSVGYGPGCHVDQVLGDSFLWQIGVEPVLPRDKVKTALKNLYKYNFSPDAGSYRNAMQAVIKGGRWYAMPGEPGLLMTTFPKGGAEVASGKGADTWSAGYFNECMHGFEYQAAAHMFAEGLIEEGMTVIRSIHDRYSAKKRNPFNEIECGDHYARSMASYGAFLTLCGFSYHGPRGRIGFAPKLKPEKFKAPFTASEGWGTYEQSRSSTSLKASYAIKFGRLRVRELTFEVAPGLKVKSAKVSRGKYSFGSTIRQDGQSVTLILEGPVQVDEGERLETLLG